MICIDARHAKAVLKMQINKSDRNDGRQSRLKFESKATWMSVRVY